MWLLQKTHRSEFDLQDTGEPGPSMSKRRCTVATSCARADRNFKMGYEYLYQNLSWLPFWSLWPPGPPRKFNGWLKLTNKWRFYNCTLEQSDLKVMQDKKLRKIKMLFVLQNLFTTRTMYTWPSSVPLTTLMKQLWASPRATL